jgi:hypothetical protein
MKAATTFLAFVLLGLGAFVYFLIWVEPNCTEAPERLQLQHWTKNHGEATYQHQNRAETNPDRPTYGFPAVKLVLTETKNSKTTQSEYYPHWEPTGWWKKFFCDAKITDVALTFFTYCLIIVGAFQARYLYHTVIATRMAAEHIPRVERAYIFLQVGQLRTVEDSPGNIIGEVMVGVTNEGKTPATIQGIYGQFAPNEPVGRPIYSGGRTIELDIAAPADRFFVLAMAPFTTKEIREQYFFGYVEYLDIFKNILKSRFCFKINPTDSKFSRAGSRAWNDRD